MKQQSHEHRGEVGVLALGKARGWEMVLDDGSARANAESDHLRATATLPLLCDAIRAEQLTFLAVEHLADALIAGECFLPSGPGEFRRWALEEALLDAEDVYR